MICARISAALEGVRTGLPAGETFSSLIEKVVVSLMPVYGSRDEELKVRIHLPPAASQERTPPSRDRVRCRGCGARARVVVSVKCGKPTA
jgi:hypothetical protein